SLSMPKWVRSLLLFGMLPSITVGTASFSFEPCPKESSLVPVGLSVLIKAATHDQSIDGDPLSHVRLASVSISKLLPGRLTSALLAKLVTATPANPISTRHSAVRPAIDRWPITRRKFVF